MLLHHGDMWQLPGLKIITTNSYINKSGELVMGRGTALEAKQRYPQLPKLAAQYITHLGEYGLLLIPEIPIGLFQVKYNWSDNADVSLIWKAAIQLDNFARMWTGSIVLNYPGIGNGRLARENVEHIISHLPDNVTVCIKD